MPYDKTVIYVHPVATSKIGWYKNTVRFYTFLPVSIKTRQKVLFQIENGRLSDRYRIGTDTGRIVSNRIGKSCIGRYYMQRCRFSSC